MNKNTEYEILLTPTNIELSSKTLVKSNITNNIDLFDFHNIGFSHNSINWIPQHVHFISNEQIKRKDVWYNKLDGTFNKAEEEDLARLNNNRQIHNGAIYAKVTASTNHALHLPNIPFSFIQKLIKLQDKIKSVTLGHGEKFEFGNMKRHRPQEYFLRTTAKNNVIITKINKNENRN